MTREGYTFSILKPRYEESHSPRTRAPKEVVQNHARNKARSVLSGVKNGVILGADTLVFFKGRLIGKPENLKEAFKILSQIQGKAHYVYTGVAIFLVIHGRIVQEKIFYDKTKVYLKKMSVEKMRAYFKRIHPLDKAGAYAIQSSSEGIVEKVQGSLSNAVGLPVEKLYAKLKPFLKKQVTHKEIYER